MHRHARLNRAYRLVFSRALGTLVVAPEIARGRSGGGGAAGASQLPVLPAGLGSGTATLKRLALAMALGLSAARGWALDAGALPTGGQVAAGNASMNTAGNTLTVNQGSQRAIINWQSFDVGQAATVNFVQPGASAVALNRVTGGGISQILGNLNANGQVYLVNPAGILFGSTAQVNVGGLVASTLGISDADFLAGRDRFTQQPGSTGSVVNQGRITIGQGGRVALLGARVDNQGQIVAPGGEVALAAGRQVTLAAGADGHLQLGVDAGELAALVKNGGLIQADGGQIVLSAQGANALASAVVSNTGTVQARTVDGRSGRILLLADLDHGGRTEVGGTLDASAPNGGNGGFIETSAQQVRVAEGTRVTTRAEAGGQTGTWLIDPTDFTISAGGAPLGISGIGANTLNSALAATSITLQTASAGSLPGDIHVNAAVSWNDHLLTLSAANNININAVMTAGGTASLALNYGGTDGNASTAPAAGSNVNTALGANGFTGRVDFTGTGNNLTINGTTYTIIKDLNALQGMQGSNPNGRYALGANIDANATATSTWNGGAGFNPIGNGTTNFIGTFDGLGHVVSGLTINRTGQDFVGLFGATGNGSSIRNIGLAGGDVKGRHYVGGLVGVQYGGTIGNTYATGSVSGSGNDVGGLVGIQYGGSINNTYATGKVSGSNYIGGLVGYQGGGSISNAYATGSVSGTYYVGGLVGMQHGGSTINNAYATGSVSGSNNVGGLAGFQGGSSTINNAYTTGSVSGSGYIGGLVGVQGTGSISNAYATGSVTGSSTAGGLVGKQNSGSNSSISNAYWDTETTGQSAGIGGGVSGGTGLTTAQMMKASNLASFDFSTTWGNAGDQSTPYLRSNPGPVFIATDPGNNTSPPPLYQIVLDVNQLQAIASNLGGRYALGNNIDASATSTWNGGAGFSPIGNNTTRFTGTLDGLGHVVNGLTINRTGQGYVGLFGATGNGSAVRHIGLVGGSVKGREFVGNLVGRQGGGTIDNAYATGSVSGTSFYVGGLVGYKYDGSIGNAYATGNVSGLGAVGGLVGFQEFGTIGNAYATGSVSGNSAVGGLVGTHFGTSSISNAYATGSVSGSDLVGGLVGAQNGGSIGNAYATGKVSSSGTSNRIGGLVGFQNGGSISNAYWDTETTDQSAGIGGGVSGGTGLTTAQMMKASNLDFDFSTIWGNAGDQSTPYLRSNPGPVFIATDLGANTPASPPPLYQIVLDVNQLQAIRNNLAGRYALGNDIDASATAGWNGESGFNPIGTYIYNQPQAAFTGSLDGLGHVVNGLTINRQGQNFVGLFGATGNGSVVRNIGLAGGSVTGRNYVGNLVGWQGSGTMDNAYATGSVSGSDYVGGLVGGQDNGATIGNAYATGNVSGTSNVGGLVGYQGGNIGNAYATGSVSGTDQVGGLVGLQNSGSISNVYATGSVTRSSGTSNRVGGLVGYHATGSISNAYWDTETTGQGSSWNGGSGVGCNTSNYCGLTTAQMLTASSFAGWDIATQSGSTSVWRIYEGHTAPLLRNFLTPVTVTATGNANRTYDGTTDASAAYSVSGPATVNPSLLLGQPSTANKNVGTYNVDFSGLYSTQQGYDISYDTTTTNNLSITPKAITISGTTASNKTYDGTTAAAITVGTVSGLVGGETLGVTATGTFDSKNAGSRVATASYTLADGSNGGLAGNYSLADTTGLSATIDKAALTIGTGNVTKTYDGTTAANGATAIATGGTQLFGTDNLTGGNFAFTDKNAGTGKTVTVSGVTVNDGNGGQNYNVSYADNTASTITPKAIASVGGIKANNKTYDGATAANLNTGTAAFDGMVAGDSLSVGSASGSFANKNVGAGKTVNIGGITLAGADAGNYSLQSTTATTTASITPKAISGTIDASNKVYDGSTAASTSGMLSGVVNGDSVTFTTSGSFSDKNVGNGKTVTVSGNLTGTDAGNYTLANNATTTADITPKAINGSIGAADKVYDATATASTSGTLTGVIGTDSVTFATSGSFSDKNVGNSKTVTVSGDLTGMDAGNYTLASNTTATADITPKAINGIIGAADKVYDATTTASTSGTLTGVLTGDSVSFATSGSFADKNVGSGKTVTVSGDLTGTDAGNYTLASNTSATADITPKAINGIIGTSNKVYDATTTASTSGTLAGVLTGDSVTFATNGSFADKNVGNGKTVTVSGDLTGTDAGNYTLASNATTTADITPKAITSVGGITANGKTYDGSTAAGLNTGAAAFDGMVAGDSLSVGSASGSFADKNVGQGKTVSIGGITLAGTDAGNYSLQSTSATTTASITPTAIASVSGITANDKIYDGATAANLNTGAATFDGMVAGDNLGVGSASGSFADKNVGQGKTVSIGGITLAGADAGNYSLQSATATTTADITPKTISGTIGAADKVYDATTTASTSGTLTGVLTGDSVTFATSGTFSDKNAGSGKTVAVSGDLTGTDAGNYTLASNTSTTADITPKTINGTIDAGNKVYDSNTTASTSGTLTGVLTSDNVTFATNGSFADKNVGTGKTVNVAGSLTGADAGNYTLASNAATTADITPKAINGSIGAADKVYDATATASTSGTLTGVLTGDSVTFATNGSFADKNVGNGKTVAVNGNLTGTDAGNYTLTRNASTTADITPLAISGTIGTADKVYDADTTASTSGTLTGVLTGDSVIFTTSGTFNNKNVGSNKTVAVSGSLTGTDASNYTLASNATASADITPKALNGTIGAGNKVYDGTTTASTSGTLTGVLTGDSVSFATSGSFSDKNVGNDKTVTVSGNLTGTDAGNYTLTRNASTTADITPLAISGTIDAGNKVYDGSTTASTSGTLTGVLTGDSVTFATSGSFSDKNVGTDKTVAVSGDLTGTDASNYTLASNTSTTADITPLAISGTIGASNKVYDGTTTAGTSGTLAGVLTGDSVTFATSGSFSDKNVGNGKTVSVAGSLTGTDAGNYTLTSNATTTADITPKAIASVSGITANDKIYDGATAANLNTGAATFDGMVAGDNLGVGSASGSFADKNVGQGKTVSIGGITLAGADAGNYSLQSATATTTADITPKTINGTIGAGNKVYDATTTTSTSGTLTGVLTGDSVSFATNGSFSDKNVGTGKTVAVSGSLTGTDAGNYTLASNATTTADITPKAINGSIGASNKVYDGTTTASTSGTLTGVLTGDSVTFATSGTFNNKNAGTDKTVTVSGDLTGTDASNYTLASNATTTADITPKTISGTIDAGNKVYDGSTTASTSGTLTGVLTGDSVTFATNGSFADKNVGTGKTVAVSGDLTGTDASNYTLASNTSTTADITPLAINGTIGASNKVYDGTTTAGTSGTLTGVLTGDSVTFATNGSFADKNVGSGKTVAVSGDLTGTDASNYTLTRNTTTTADITPKAINGSIGASNKVYDGTTTAGTSGTLTGVLTGDSVSFATSGSFADKNVGSGKTVTVSGDLTGTDAGNYTLASNTSTTADITPLAINGTIGASNKVYDGNTTASTSGTLSGVVNGDSVTFATNGSFADKNVGNNKTVTVSSSLTGTDAGNYTLTRNDTTTADITPLAISGTIGAADKVYDATTTASTSGTLTGVLTGDSVTFATSGTFNNKNVGSGKTVTVSGDLTGTDAGNYTLSRNATTTADITPATLVITTNDAAKAWDGRPYAGGNGVSFSGFVGGEDAAVLGGALVYGGSSQGASLPGSYGLSASGLGSGNYLIQHREGTLRIAAPVETPMGGQLENQAQAALLIADVAHAGPASRGAAPSSTLPHASSEPQAQAAVGDMGGVLRIAQDYIKVD